MDDLTGLLNRREVFDRLESLINTGVTGGGPHLAVCFIDVDDFKSYNDSFGHHIGDDILRNLATDVRAVLRAGDLAARVGGDEVLVVLSGVTAAKQAVKLAEALRTRVATTRRVDGTDLQVRVSIGVALAEPGESVDAVVERADHAMYRAKVSGGNRVVAASVVRKSATA